MHDLWRSPCRSPCLHLSLPHSICQSLTCSYSFPSKHTDLFSCCSSWIILLLWSFSLLECLWATKCDKCYFAKSRSCIQVWFLWNCSPPYGHSYFPLCLTSRHNTQRPVCLPGYRCITATSNTDTPAHMLTAMRATCVGSSIGSA